eukprot:271912-Chlamydomonas_euryale.AAC.1
MCVWGGSRLERPRGCGPFGKAEGFSVCGEGALVGHSMQVGALLHAMTGAPPPPLPPPPPPHLKGSFAQKAHHAEPTAQRPTIQRPTMQRPAMQRPAMQRPTMQRPAMQRPAMQSQHKSAVGASFVP